MITKIKLSISIEESNKYRVDCRKKSHDNTNIVQKRQRQRGKGKLTFYSVHHLMSHQLFFNSNIIERRRTAIKQLKVLTTNLAET